MQFTEMYEIVERLKIWYKSFIQVQTSVVSSMSEYLWCKHSNVIPGSHTQ